MPRPRPRQLATLVSILVLTASAVWATWPGQLFTVREGGLTALLTAHLPAAIIRVVPGGTATLVTEAGTRALPDTVVLRGGTPAVLRIENTDTVLHRLGPFAVTPRTTRSFTIASAGVYSGYCTAHPGRRITYFVP
jgi:hypothetical protein